MDRGRLFNIIPRIIRFCNGKVQPVPRIRSTLHSSLRQRSIEPRIPLAACGD